MGERPIQLTLHVELEDDADEEELEAAVESLRADLAESPVDVERPPGGEAPPGSKGVAREAAGLLLVTGGTAALEVAADYVKDWLSRRRRSRVQLTGAGSTEVVVMVPGMSSADARDLIAQLSRSALT